MLAKVNSVAVNGLDAQAVEVEVDLASGLPMFTVVGLPDPTVRESRERVRSALRNSGFTFPQRRVTVNLAPADLRKGGRCLRSADRHRHPGRRRSHSLGDPAALRDGRGIIVRRRDQISPWHPFDGLIF